MGNIGSILVRVFTSFIAVSCMAIAFQGHLLKVLGWISRAGFLIAGLLLIYPYWVTDVVGYLLLGILIFLHVVTTRDEKNIPSARVAD